MLTNLIGCCFPSGNKSLTNKKDIALTQMSNEDHFSKKSNCNVKSVLKQQDIQSCSSDSSDDNNQLSKDVKKNTYIKEQPSVQLVEDEAKKSQGNSVLKEDNYNNDRINLLTNESISNKPTINSRLEIVENENESDSNEKFKKPLEDFMKKNGVKEKGIHRSIVIFI